MKQILAHPKTIVTTLGDLIAAVADEVAAIMGDSPRKDLVVAYIVSDVLSRSGKGYGARKIHSGGITVPRQFGRRKAADRF